MTECRQQQRESLLFDLNVVLDNQQVPCQIIDISAGGCRIKTDLEFKSMDSILLEIKNFGKINGQVRWHNPPYTGIMFLEEPEKITELLAAIATYGPH